MEGHVPEEDIALAVAGVIPPAEAVNIEAHLTACAQCAQAAAFYRGIVEVLRLSRPVDQTRPAIHDRLRQGGPPPPLSRPSAHGARLVSGGSAGSPERTGAVPDSTHPTAGRRAGGDRRPAAGA